MKVPTQQELIRILNHINPRSAFGLRDRAILLLLANTGLRVSELVGLDVHHVRYDFEDQLREALDVPREWAKGAHSRTIPLNGSAKQAIAEALSFNRMRGFSLEPEAPLFQDRWHRRLPIRSVQRMVQHYRELADAADTITPHKLRHFFADRALERSGHIRAVQQLLGHKRLETVEIYTRATPDDLRRAVGD